MYVLGQAGNVEITLTADAPAAVAGVVTLTGTVATDGTPPTASDAVEVQTVAPPSPPPPPPGGGPDPIPLPGPYDPGAHSVPDVKAYMLGLGPDDDPTVVTETQHVLDAERAGKNRAGLVHWLDSRPGIV